MVSIIKWLWYIFNFTYRVKCLKRENNRKQTFHSLFHSKIFFRFFFFLNSRCLIAHFSVHSQLAHLDFNWVTMKGLWQYILADDAPLGLYLAVHKPSNKTSFFSHLFLNKSLFISPQWYFRVVFNCVGLITSFFTLNRTGKMKFGNKSYLRGMSECLNIHLHQIFQTCKQVSGFFWQWVCFYHKQHY